MAAHLEERRKKWKDSNYLAFDPDEILEEKAIDSTVTGYLTAGKFEPSASKAAVIAVERRNKMKEKAEAKFGQSATLGEDSLETCVVQFKYGDSIL